MTPVNGLKRVLLAEQNDELRTLYGDQLHDAGYEVVYATNCDEAVSALASGPPFTTVCINEEIPGGGAQELLKRAKQVDGQSPYLVLGAGLDFGGTTVEMYRSGAAKCLEINATGLAALVATVKSLDGDPAATLLTRLGLPRLKREIGT